MINFVCNYDLYFSHPNRSALVKLINNNSKKDLNFQSSPKKNKNNHLFSVRATASVEENGNFSFLDVLDDINQKSDLLEIGGSFMDNVGRGYVDSLCQKQYTKTY